MVAGLAPQAIGYQLVLHVSAADGQREIRQCLLDKTAALTAILLHLELLSHYYSRTARGI